MKKPSKLVNMLGGLAVAGSSLFYGAKNSDAGLIEIRSIDRTGTYGGSTAFFANIVLVHREMEFSLQGVSG